MNLNLNYIEDVAKIQRFVEEFKSTAGLKYSEMLKQVSTGDLTRIMIELDDVLAFYPDAILVKNIAQNTRRYHSLFCLAIDPLVPESINLIRNNSRPIDVMIASRRELDRQREAKGLPIDQDNMPFPPVLLRK